LIKPKDAARYGYRLWVDEENFILLKSDLLSEQGNVLEQTMFADIRIGDDIPDIMLTPESHSDDFTWFKHESVGDELADGNRKLIDSRWMISDLPQGFSVTTRFHHQMPNSSVPTEHWVLSDGLASVSIYLEKIPDGQSGFQGVSTMGATNAFGILKQDASDEAHQITVIGEVPSSTVEKIARAVVLKTQ
jgi:sigma-E factor negative regulatory protein RseB